MDFKRPQLEDTEILRHYLDMVEYRGCELSAANTIFWSCFYKIEYAVVDDFLLFKGHDDSFNYPVGQGDMKIMIEKLMEYSKAHNSEFKLRSVAKEMFEELDNLFPGKFQITYNRDNADYLYLSEKLITLSGKKYHGKRNHINKFKELNPDWNYERLTDENVQECIEMAREWGIQNECDSDFNKKTELEVTFRYLEHYKTVGVVGGVLRVAGKVVAFTLGEPICKDTFAVHIEKAFADIQGAYPMINQQFVADYATDYMYINREEDMGSEGLRKAKLSYRPVDMVEKGSVTLI